MTQHDRNLMKTYWNQGNRLEAFALYLMASIPNDWLKYASRLPELEVAIDGLESIDGFRGTLIELIRGSLTPH